MSFNISAIDFSVPGFICYRDSGPSCYNNPTCSELLCFSPLVVAFPVVVCLLFPSVCIPISVPPSFDEPLPPPTLPPPPLPLSTSLPPLPQPTQPPPLPTQPPQRPPDPLENFDNFKATCNKNYVSQEAENARREIFTSNVERIRNGQMSYDLGLRTYDLRINCFGDLTFEEFGATNTGFGILGGDEAVIDDSIEPVTERIVPDTRRDYVQQATSLDWSLSGNVSPVLKQDPCNSCAAHAAVSAIESCLSIASNTAPKPLSQQQLVDCTIGLTQDNGTELERTNQGCQSAFPDNHLYFISGLGNQIQSAEEYPLTPNKIPDGTCPVTFTYYGYEDYNQLNGQVPASVSDFRYKWFATEEDLLHRIQSGPVVTNVDITEDFQFFFGEGVFYNENQCTNYVNEPVPEECRRAGTFGYTCLKDCKDKLPDHCDSYGWEYWKFKNSWGADDWGDNGYGRIVRGIGHCGVGSYFMQPVCG